MTGISTKKRIDPLKEAGKATPPELIGRSRDYYRVASALNDFKPELKSEEHRSLDHELSCMEAFLKAHQRASGCRVVQMATRLD